MKDTTEQEAYQKLTALCARSEHCQHDIIEKMRLWGFDEETQKQVTNRLVEERYVDDARYTRAYVNDKVHYAKWGRRKIEQGLWMKHIDAQLAKTALDEVDDADYVATLRPMLRQKRKSTKAQSEYELNMKLIKYAMSRGFTMDIIKQCIDVEDEDEFSV